MTMVTYTLAPIDQGVTSGVHNGKIINTKIITFQDSNETQFSVEWKIGESTFLTNSNCGMRQRQKENMLKKN